VAYAIFDTPAIHGIPGIKELAQAGSEMVPPLVIATAQLLQVLDDWPRSPLSHRVPIIPTMLASGALNRSGDTLSVELHQPTIPP
jgi:hypothetical protein